MRQNLAWSPLRRTAINEGLNGLGRANGGFIESLRKAGWTDPELYEATFDIALFAFFNRMANAYGLDYAASGWPRPTGAKY